MPRFNARNETSVSKTFDVFNVLFLGLYGILTLVPFVYIVAASFASELEIQARPFFIIPNMPTLTAYRIIFTTSALANAAKNSGIITLLGTVISMLVTLMTAYVLTKPILGRKTIIGFFIFAMFFSGGMIPSYIVVSSLGLLNTFWAIILPGSMSIYNMVIVRNFFMQLEPALLDSAEVDGAGHMRILIQIVLPLSMPVIATFSLFYAVGYWNNYFGALLYLRNQTLWPLPVLLRSIVMQSQLSSFDRDMVDGVTTMPEYSVKMAVIVVATFPIMIVYPFLQKHFAKGVMIGAIKG